MWILGATHWVKFVSTCWSANIAIVLKHTDTQAQDHELPGSILLLAAGVVQWLVLAKGIPVPCRPGVPAQKQ